MKKRINWLKFGAVNVPPPAPAVESAGANTANTTSGNSNNITRIGVYVFKNI